MKIEDINFPVYRCYKNRKTYFKILNPHEFEEVQLIGSFKKIRTIKAEQFPEMVFIRDLVLNFSEMALEISEKDYETILQD
ncbi:MAG: hypothetical protein JNK73_11290 [Bacteroidia bacterium]|nr:hypothetical protein [Bacteroidia bacterium]